MQLTVTRSYSHHLVVSDLALIRIERRSEEELRQASTIVLVVGALLGPPLAALAEWIGLPGGPARLYLPRRPTPALGEMRDVVTCWAADVPDELLRSAQWPSVEPFRPVTFYPRSLIESIVLTRWGTLALTLRREAAREVHLTLPLLGRRRVVEHLHRAGYPVRSWN
jgi:hypothetical protein